MDSIQSLTGHAPADKRFVSVKLDADLLTKLDGDMQPANKVRMLSTRQVKQIAALLPVHSLHDHDPKSLRSERLSGKHGHTHEVDIPTQILDVIFWPLHRFAALWDSQFSHLNGGPVHGEHLRPVLDYNEALDKQLGRMKGESVEFKDAIPCPDSAEHAHPVADTQLQFRRPKYCQEVTQSNTKKIKIFRPKQTLESELTIYHIERHKEKYLNGVFVGTDVANERKDSLSAAQKKLRTGNIEEIITAEKLKPIHSMHRFFFNNNRHRETDTNRFLEKLSARVARVG